MKSATITTVLSFFALLWFVEWVVKHSKEYPHEQEQIADHFRDTTNKIATGHFPDTTMEVEANFELLRLAIIEAESEGEPFAVNPDSGAFGLYQITEGGYLARYNQITGENMTMEDLKDVRNQHKVFYTVQAHDNPTKDLKKALIVHNPNAMSYHYVTCYEAKVMAVYWKLKYEQAITTNPFLTN